jgi:hypothetical protein
MKPVTESLRPVPVETAPKMSRTAVIVEFAKGVRDGTRLGLKVAAVVTRVSPFGLRDRLAAALDHTKAVVEEGPGQYKKTNDLLDEHAEKLKDGDKKGAAEVLKEIKKQTGQT